MITTIQYFYIGAWEIQVLINLSITQESFSYSYGSINGVERLPIETQILDFSIQKIQKVENRDGFKISEIRDLLEIAINDWSNRLTEDEINNLID